MADENYSSLWWKDSWRGSESTRGVSGEACASQGDRLLGLVGRQAELERSVCGYSSLELCDLVCVRNNCMLRGPVAIIVGSRDDDQPYRRPSIPINHGSPEADPLSCDVEPSSISRRHSSKLSKHVNEQNIRVDKRKFLYILLISLAACIPASNSPSVGSRDEFRASWIAES